MKKIVIAGATSKIAIETAKMYALRGDCLFLIGRNEFHLNSVRDDLLIRGAKSVEVMLADLGDCSTHSAIVRSAESIFGAIDILLVAYGILGDQSKGQKDAQTAIEILNCNFLSVVSLLT